MEFTIKEWKYNNLLTTLENEFSTVQLAPHWKRLNKDLSGNEANFTPDFLTRSQDVSSRQWHSFENVTSLEKRPTQELLLEGTQKHRQHRKVVSLCDVAKQFKRFSLMILMYI